MLLLASVLRPPSPALVDVVVAAVDLPAGSTLAAEDMALLQVPADYAPPGATSLADDVVGRTLATAVVAGEAITATRVVATGPRPDGLITVPVRLADAEAAALLEPGSIIDLVLASGDSGGRVIAEGARVVTVPRVARDGGLGATTRAAGSLIVVATDRRTAVALAATGVRNGLGVVMR